MIADLDPGFTVHGFWINVLLVFIGSFFGAAGAFAAAWYIYRRQSKEERERLELELRESREQFQATIARDVQMRREEDQQQKEDRSKAQQELLAGVLWEIKLNIRALTYMRQDWGRVFGLRLDAYAAYRPHLSDLPTTLADDLMEMAMLVDRFNAVKPGSDPRRDSRWNEAIDSVLKALQDAGHGIADYLQPGDGETYGKQMAWRLNLRDGLEYREPQPPREFRFPGDA